MWLLKIINGSLVSSPQMLWRFIVVINFRMNINGADQGEWGEEGEGSLRGKKCREEQENRKWMRQTFLCREYILSVFLCQSHVYVSCRTVVRKGTQFRLHFKAHKQHFSVSKRLKKMCVRRPGWVEAYCKLKLMEFWEVIFYELEKGKR